MTDFGENRTLRLAVDLGRAEALIAEMHSELSDWQDWSNTIACRMPVRYDGDESQEFIIDRWLDDVTAAATAVLATVRDVLSVDDQARLDDGAYDVDSSFLEDVGLSVRVFLDLRAALTDYEPPPEPSADYQAIRWLIAHEYVEPSNVGRECEHVTRVTADGRGIGVCGKVRDAHAAPVHMCPEPGSVLTQCCRRSGFDHSVFEGHRFTAEPAFVTCSSWRPR